MFQAIVLAGLPASGCDLVQGDCEAKDSAAFLKLREPFDAQMVLGLESCRLDAETCVSLCRMALVRAEAKGEELEGSVRACDVKFVDDGANLSLLLHKSDTCDDVVDAFVELAVRELYESDRAHDLPALGLPDALQARGLLRRASHSLWNGAIA